MSLLTELAAAVEARAGARQLRHLLAGKSSNGRPARSLKQRIARREALSGACLRELRVQARVLISDRAELKDALAALRRLERTFREHAAGRHRAFDLPPHRPSDERQFRADCQHIMRRHRVGPSEAATAIVRHAAHALPKGARTDLLGVWTGEREQIEHLADSMRKPV